MAVAWLWGKVGDELGLSSRGKWLGFVAFFLNFTVLKMGSFYPVVTPSPPTLFRCRSCTAI